MIAKAPTRDEPKNIILIGMSGTGKTHWAKFLAKHLGRPHVEFDELIGQSPQLATLLQDYPGKDAAEKMGKFFGMPWTDGFTEREQQFLAIERTIMAADYPPGSILDLTGSAIYHPTEMARLKETGLVIYLETSEDARKAMFDTFMKHPKPVCWRGTFSKKRNESDSESLKRCYPSLLESRAKMYASYADVTIPYEQHKNFKSATDFTRTVVRLASRLPGLDEKTAVLQPVHAP